MTTSFTIPGPDMAATVANAARYVPSKAMHPILNGLLVEVGRDRIALTAHDTEITAVYTVAAETAGPGRFLVPGRLLATIAKYFGKSDVDFSLKDDGRVHVTAGRSASWTLPTLTVEDYPQLPTGGDPVGRCDGAELRDALARVLPAADREGIAPMWGAVQLRTDTDSGDLEVVTSDRFRIALAHVPWMPVLHDTSNEPPILHVRVPRHFIDAATHIIGSETSSVAIHAAPGTVTFAGAGRRLTGRLVAHEWPDVYAPLPTKAVRSATITVDEMTGAVERVLAVSDGRPASALMAHPVRVEFTRERILMSAQIDDNQAHAECTVSDYDAPPMVFALNPLFLHDCLKTMRTEFAELWLGAKNTRPLAFYPIDDDGRIVSTYRHIMMPIQPQKVGADAQ